MRQHAPSSKEGWNSSTRVNEARQLVMREGCLITRVHTVGFRPYEIREQVSLMYDGGGQEGGYPWEMLTGRGTREPSGILDIFLVLIWVVATLGYTYVNFH